MSNSPSSSTRAIYKYALKVTDEQSVHMPKGAQLLSVQVQRGELFVWAVVNIITSPVEVKFRIFGTGHPFDIEHTDGWEFLDTVQLDGGALVFHVFAKEPAE